MPSSQKPSARQLAANRANAAHSTGPRTAQGKARSAQNARKATFITVGPEGIDEIARLTADLTALHHPVNSLELLGIERMALAQQALLRAARIESGLLTVPLNHALNHTRAPAEGFHQLAFPSRSWSVFLRYQARADRQYRRAVEEFEHIKTLRSAPPVKLQNEPNFETHAEEKKTACVSENEPDSFPAPIPLKA